jgi:hypothetical protein
MDSRIERHGLSVEVVGQRPAVELDPHVRQVTPFGIGRSNDDRRQQRVHFGKPTRAVGAHGLRAFRCGTDEQLLACVDELALFAERLRALGGRRTLLDGVGAGAGGG